jgi:hypothetical protein
VKKKLLFFSIAAMISLSACGNQQSQGTNQDNNEESSHSETNHSGMNHLGSGEVPKDLKPAENPTYEVGSQAIINADHMEGMDGAESTIVGAYDTTVYTISYTPTTGGERVTNHKWVIHEEIKNAGDEPFEQGEEVTLQADHMEGMNGATAEIDSAQQTTVYMVDYTPTNGEEKVTNHKWVTESELTAK